MQMMDTSADGCEPPIRSLGIGQQPVSLLENMADKQGGQAAQR